eukprot:Opistho-2@88398
MEATALHDFAATSPDEVSFKNGSIVKIINMDDCNWYKAETDFGVGFIPSNYVQMKDHSFFHGKIPRASSEQLLLNNGTQGSYLIRESESSPGDFSLSVKHDQGVQHFRIMRDDTRRYYLWEKEKFISLNALLEHFKKASVSKQDNIVLRQVLPKVQPPTGGPRVTQQVRALFDFNPQEEGELGFKKGEIVQVLDDSDPNWWMGACNGTTGLFPSSYVNKC